MEADIPAEAMNELLALPAADRRAIETAIDKLEARGDRLGFPHSSAVQSATGTLRELRPQQGRSRWRAFYRRIGDRMVIAAVGPEAGVNARGFDRAVAAAAERLAALEADDE